MNSVQHCWILLTVQELSSMCVCTGVNVRLQVWFSTHKTIIALHALALKACVCDHPLHTMGSKHMLE